MPREVRNLPAALALFLFVSTVLLWATIIMAHLNGNGPESEAPGAAPPSAAGVLLIAPR